MWVDKEGRRKWRKKGSEKIEVKGREAEEEEKDERKRENKSQIYLSINSLAVRKLRMTSSVITTELKIIVTRENLANIDQKQVKKKNQVVHNLHADC